MHRHLTRLTIGVALAGSLAGVTSAFAADRLSDRDVKTLVARIDTDSSRFVDALDDPLKRSIIRGPDGEVNVARFLDDFRKSVDRLEDRLAPQYAASTETAAVLRQASTIDRFFRQQPNRTKGESEWNRLAADLTTLAAAYGTSFPLTEGAAVRRIGDGELVTTIDAIASSADRLKKSLDEDLKRDTSVTKTERTSIVREADGLSKDAKALARRVKDGKPSSVEAGQLAARVATLRTATESYQLPAATPLWADITERLAKVRDAYATTSAK
jgi:hypothetical protein